MNTVQTTAAEVRSGDTLPALGNGYVFEDPEPAADAVSWGGRFATALDEDLVLISFHDAEGEENYLILRAGHPIEVSR